MTAYLIDTHVLLWALDDDKRLSKAQSAILSSDAIVNVSMASLWEIAIKTSLNKLEAPAHLVNDLAQANYEILDIDIRDIETVSRLPHHHGDPFDRMLIAQAQVRSLPILTNDRQFAKYDVALA